MPDIAAVAIPTVLLSQNWIKNSEVESAWKTQIDSFSSADEQRRGLTDKPSRVLTQESLTFARNDTGRLLNQIRLGTQGRYYYPIACDETVSTTSASSATLTINCDTVDRRFFVGFKALVVIWSRDLNASHIHVGVIASVTPTSLTFEIGDEFTQTIPSGSSVFPAIEAEISLTQDASRVTDQYLTYTANIIERVGSAALPSLVAAGSYPAGEPGYRSLPILGIDENIDKIGSVGRIRRGVGTGVGTDTIYQLYGNDAFITAKLPFDQMSRADAFRLLRFFDSRGGSTHSFWYANRTSDVEIISKTSNTVFRFVKSVTAADFLHHKFIAFWSKGTVAVRRILSCVDMTTYLDVSIDEAVTLTQDQIYKTSWACLARFDTDALKESWITNTIMSSSLSIVGLNPASDVNCIGEGCEGGCEDTGDCPEPEDPTTDDPPEQPWEPDPACEASPVDLPMFFDCTQVFGSGREPIRAADFTAPNTFKISIKNTLIQDENHPHTDPMSEALKRELYRQHFLEYTGAVTRSGSRNPYHTRIEGTDPIYSYVLPSGSVAVNNSSPKWEKTIPYVVGEDEHTLSLRIYAEWVDRTALTDQTEGAWGMILCFVAWSTEIMPDYEDGDAVPAFDNLEFFIEDPMVSGNYGDSLDISEKYFHPKLLIAAVLATSWHSPVGYDWHPPDRSDRLHECFAETTGAPWGSSGGQPNALGNSVFGGVVGSTSMAAMSLGGWTVSEPLAWLCIENTGGEGRTLLKPTYPGWDEDVGFLTLRNDISIEICSPSQTPISGCSGHPLDPAYNSDISTGGTHACWRNSAGEINGKYLCVPAGRVSDGRVRGNVLEHEMCVTTRPTYGPDEGESGFCQILTTDCSSAPIDTSIIVPLYDYTFAFGAAGSLRKYECRGYVNDPDYVNVGWIYDSGDPDTYNDWAQTLGGWTFSALMTCSSLATGDANGRALAEYNKQIDDGSIQASLPYTAATTVRMGLGIRLGTFGGTIVSGYTAIVSRYENLVRLWKLDSGTRTLLGQRDIADDLAFTGEIDFFLRAYGSKIRAHWFGGSHFIEVDDCEYQTGGTCGLILEGTTAGIYFSDVQIVDENWRKVEASIIVRGDEDLIETTVQFEACNGYTSPCDGCLPSSCTGIYPSGCNCTAECKQVFGLYSISSSAYSGGNAAPLNGEWRPPYDAGSCDDEPCTGEGPSCRQCPAPWKALEGVLPGNCQNPDMPTNSLFVEGVEGWIWDELVCT